MMQKVKTDFAFGYLKVIWLYHMQQMVVGKDVAHGHLRRTQNLVCHTVFRQPYARSSTCALRPIPQASQPRRILLCLLRCLVGHSPAVHGKGELSCSRIGPTSSTHINQCPGTRPPSSFEVIHISHLSRLNSMSSNTSQLIQLIITREISHNESLQLNSQIRPVI